MDALILAQTVFYIVFSIAIFTLSLLLCIVTYYFIGIARHMRHVSERVDNVSEEVRKQIESIVKALQQLPFISYLFKKKSRVQSKKNRKGR